MAKPLLPDELWERIEPLLPPPKPRRFRFPGRKPLDNRKALTGILFVLKTGIPWEYLPLEMGCGSGMTCWRRLRDWQAAGVWQQLHEILLAELNAADKIDWSRAVIDASFVRALGGGERTGPSPVDRRKKGSKHHVLTDGQGVPLATATTAANVNEVTQLRRLVEAIPPVRGKPGRPRRRPDRLYGDRGYDSEPERRWLRRRGIEPFLARRGTEHGSGLGVYRWVVERTLSWLHAKRKLRVRTDRRTDIHQAFLSLACSLICLIFL
ncbi:MAG TPA: IS5 family transposase [Terriglobales bacterium]|nr:IS5 family transposase [Terriglobales bacterium]